MKKIITRFPPSPTGYFHIGSARTALFNYLFASHNEGTMYFRFEDTDTERSKKEYEDDIIESMAWLDIPYTWPDIKRQSERKVIYKKYFKKLLDANLAYEAEPSNDDPEKKVIRFKNPNKTITFTDLVRGEVTFDTTELQDFVIAKSIDEPLYHLAVVIDDYEMGVTHVIRGEDHISNTPRQILILEALGFERPRYAHLPLILAPDRSKLSKRHGAVSVNEYRAQGYLPEAMLNYLALLGWNPGTGQELFSLSEMAKQFDFRQVQRSGAIFDIEKLRWFNREYLKRMNNEVFLAYIQPAFPETRDREVKKLLPLIRERISTLQELKTMVAAGEYTYFFTDPSVDPLYLSFKDTLPEVTKTHLSEVCTLLEDLDESAFDRAESIKATIWDYATEKGRGAVLWPIRFALTGKEKSPDPFSVASIIGKEATLRRLTSAIERLIEL